MQECSKKPAHLASENAHDDGYADDFNQRINDITLAATPAARSTAKVESTRSMVVRGKILYGRLCGDPMEYTDALCNLIRQIAHSRSHVVLALQIQPEARQ